MSSEPIFSYSYSIRSERYMNHRGIQKYQILVLFFSLQDEFLDVIYWFRQIIAVILGVIWGIVPLKGFIGIAM